MKKRKLSFTSVGGSSILTIFAVLCFLVFALLSLTETSTFNEMLKNPLKNTGTILKSFAGLDSKTRNMLFYN